MLSRSDRSLSVLLISAKDTRHAEVFPFLPAWFLASFWWLLAQPRACGSSAVGRTDD